MHKRLPIASSETGLAVLQALAQQKTMMAALEVMHAQIGNTFQITLPSFKPVVFVGPEANRHILVNERQSFCWRTESDPVTKLLRQGVLVLDGRQHDEVRRVMDAPLVRREVLPHVPSIVAETDQILDQWRDGQVVDMLVEMRRVALVALLRPLFKIDFLPQMENMWQTIMRVLAYISPGAWLVFPKAPRWGYGAAIAQMDAFLYRVIAARRANLGETDDLLGRLIASGMDDGLIRDQLLTMLIAGHDTSTALLAWVWLLLGRHPQTMAAVQAEVRQVLGKDKPTAVMLAELPLLDGVIKETLRLYPPIHVGNRFMPQETEVLGYGVPAGARVMLSIYLTQRDPAHWENPTAFCPERFALSESKAAKERPAMAYIPFGGGPRNCIGAAFAQVEAKAVLARILQRFDLVLARDGVRPFMGATLEPRPGVFMQVRSDE